MSIFSNICTHIYAYSLHIFYKPYAYFDFRNPLLALLGFYNPLLCFASHAGTLLPYKPFAFQFLIR